MGGQSESDDDESDAGHLAVRSVGQERGDQQRRPELDRCAEASQRSGDGRPATGCEQGAPGQHRRKQVEPQVGQRSDQEDEEQPEVDAEVMLPAGGPVERVMKAASISSIKTMNATR